MIADLWKRRSDAIIGQGQQMTAGAIADHLLEALIFSGYTESWGFDGWHGPWTVGLGRPAETQLSLMVGVIDEQLGLMSSRWGCQLRPARAPGCVYLVISDDRQETEHLIRLGAWDIQFPPSIRIAPVVMQSPTAGLTVAEALVTGIANMLYRPKQLQELVELDPPDDELFLAQR